MKNRTVRRVLLVAAGSVFLLSGSMVLKYNQELRTGAQFTNDIAQLVVTYEKQPATQTEAEFMCTSPQTVLTQTSSVDKGEESYIVSSETVESLAELSDDVQSETADTMAMVSEGIYFAADEAGIEPSGIALEQGAKETKAEPSDMDEAHTSAEITGNTLRAAPIQVDFNTLFAMNQDVVAWLYCPDTPINYPVVQAADNEYYMHRLVDGRNSYPGTLFLDYRNSDDFSDWNTVIYGHNMRNNSMFGTLPEYKQKAYLESHPEIYLLTPECNYVINVVSGFVTPNDSDLYNALRPDDEEKERLVKMCLKDTDTALEDYPAAQDRMVTLSTCSYEYNNARFVLIGILEEL